MSAAASVERPDAGIARQLIDPSDSAAASSMRSSTDAYLGAARRGVEVLGVGNSRPANRRSGGRGGNWTRELKKEAEFAAEKL
jgi:hypothetical protein